MAYRIGNLIYYFLIILGIKDIDNQYTLSPCVAVKLEQQFINASNRFTEFAYGD